MSGQEDRKHRKDNREGGAVPGKENGKDRGKGRESNRGHGKREVKTALWSTPCGGKRHRCRERSEHNVLSYAWQNDVKASVYVAWQISPICRKLAVGAFVLDGTKPFYDPRCVGRTENANM